MNELSREARELLANLDDADGPSAVQTARMKRNLGLTLGVAGGLLAVGGATGAAHAAASAASAGAAVGSAAVGVGAKVGGTGVWGLLSVFALGAAAGVGVSTTTVLVRNYSAAPSEVAVVKSTASARSAQRAPAIAAAEPLAGARAAAPALSDAVEPAAMRPPPPSAPQSVAEPVRAAASAGAEPTLGPELELVIAAKRELTLGRPAQALAIVERLAVEFPSGALREERMLLKVLSLCSLGQLEPARREARAFAAAAPRSPLLARLERSCGGDAGPAPRPGEGR